MGTILDELSQERKQQIVKDYIPRVFEVQAPCQWLEHCYNGKCPAFVRKNGNYYCAKKRP
ncbi:MAG: hypothetical protein NWF01_06845 [Candidatus Bathyarchaeota archaeon]|nr:hypothetical protein [Candidatus Bathyarchaeota archaeon]